MSGPQFFETRMGQQFYDGTMRRIADALTRIAAALEQTAQREALDDIYAIVDGRAWSADTCDAIAQVLTVHGYTIHPPEQS